MQFYKAAGMPLKYNILTSKTPTKRLLPFQNAKKRYFLESQNYEIKRVGKAIRRSLVRSAARSSTNGSKLLRAASS